MISPLRSGAAPRAAQRTDSARPQGSNGASYASAAQGAHAPAASAPLPAVASLDALMALQTIDGGAGRRDRASRRGTALLDDLDALKLAILEGRSAGDELDRIGELIAMAREASGDDGLDSLIDDIELRAQVEIAKHRR